MNTYLSLRITGCVSISAFVSLVGISIGITISAIRLKICAISAVIKKYKSLIKKEKNKQDKTIFSSKSKMNRIEVVISKVLIHSVISPDDFLKINNVLKEYNEKQKKSKILMINKYVWCNKKNINIIKKLYWN